MTDFPSSPEIETLRAEVRQLRLDNARLRDEAFLRSREFAQRQQDLWVCTGCGSQKSIEQIRGEHPGAIACCPERKMAPADTSTDRGPK